MNLVCIDGYEYSNALSTVERNLVFLMHTFTSICVKNYKTNCVPNGNATVLQAICVTPGVTPKGL